MSDEQTQGGTGDYPHVFSPVTIGNVHLQNRIFVPAHTTNFGHDHLPTTRHRDYHEARAKGGAGLIIFESIRVHRTSLGKPQGVAGYDPGAIEPFRAIADAVHAHGTAMFGQLIHLGRQIDGDSERAPAWGPSPIPWTVTAPVPHVMDESDISQLIDGFVASARNIMKAGLDGFEVHLGHGHLLQQFLSPVSNRRDDGYGGSEPNRLRLSIEVLQALRDAVGPEVCMGIRVSGDEFLPGGLTRDDMARIVPELLAAEQIDFVNVSHAAYHGSYSLATQIADMSFPVEDFRDITMTIKDAVVSAGHNIPVMAVCKFRTIAEAEEMLASGSADLVGMARAHIADPNLVAKAAAGEVAHTKPCIGCNQGCTGFLEKGLPITCVVNPGTGKEAEWAPEPADAPSTGKKRVLVVGGGPAGLETAWVSAARGHDVTLWERDGELGGALRDLRHLPTRRDFMSLIDHQIASCRRYGVDVHTRIDADANAVAGFGADVVVLAVGADAPAVVLADGTRAATVVEAIRSPYALGDNIAFYDQTGSWAAISAVEHLATLGKQLTIFTPGPTAAWNVTIYSRLGIAERLRSFGVRTATGHHISGFDNGVLSVLPLDTDAIETRSGFDSVVAAGHGSARSQLAQRLATRGVRARSVGDCVAPRTALEAVYEGHELARGL